MNTIWYCEHGCLIAKRGNCEYLTWSIDQVQGMFFSDLLNANRHLSDLLVSITQPDILASWARDINLASDDREYAKQQFHALPIFNNL